MSALFAYITIASIWLLLFHLIYRLMLKPVPSPVFNRSIILGGLGLTLIIPFLRITLPPDAMPTSNLPRPIMNLPVISTEQNLQGIIPWAPPGTPYSLSLDEAVIWIWVLGFLLTTVLLALKLFRIFIYLRTAKPVENAPFQHCLYQPKLSRAASFGKYLFWHEPVYDPKDQIILEHELTHHKLHHVLDNLAFAFLKTIFWFHPSVYYLQHELQLVHELTVDQILIRKIAPSEYLKILSRYQKELYHPLTTGFASYLEQRISYMILKKKTKQTRLIKISAAIIVTISVLLFSAFKNDSSRAHLMGWSERPIFQYADHTTGLDDSAFILQWGNAQFLLQPHLEVININESTGKQKYKPLLLLSNSNQLINIQTLLELLKDKPVLHYKNRNYRIGSDFNSGFISFNQKIQDTSIWRDFNFGKRNNINYPDLSTVAKIIHAAPGADTYLSLNLFGEEVEVRIYLYANRPESDWHAYLQVGNNEIPLTRMASKSINNFSMPRDLFINVSNHGDLISNREILPTKMERWVLFYPDTILSFTEFPSGKFTNAIGCIIGIQADPGIYLASLSFTPKLTENPTTTLTNYHFLDLLSDQIIKIAAPVTINYINSPLSLEWGNLIFCLDGTCKNGTYHVKPKEFEKMLRKIPVLNQNNTRQGDTLYLDIYHIRRQEVPVTRHLIYDLRRKKIISGQEDLDSMKSQYLVDEFFTISRVALHKNGPSIGGGAFQISYKPDITTPDWETNTEKLQETIAKVFK